MGDRDLTASDNMLGLNGKRGGNSPRLPAGPAKKPMSQAEWLVLAQKHLATMPPSESVIREMRDGARY